ncbi:hypothetical protein ES705_24637 [subsurface metagenome]
MEAPKAIEELSDYCDRGVTTFDADFKDAVRMGRDALILLSHRTTYCLDDHSLKLLRDAQRSESEQ